MTAPLEPNIDAYGTYARAGALADWLEVAAIAGVSMSRADLEDLIADNGWTTMKPRQFKLPADQQDDLPPETWAEAVIAQFDERALVLGNGWPFEQSESGRLTRLAGPSPTPYEGVLALSVAHAWKIQAGHKPESVLEDTALRALQAKGIRAAGTGTADRAGRGFVQVVHDAAGVLGLRAQPTPSPSHIRAKDAGVDTLAMVGWPDLRPAGQWIKIGQVTVGLSDSWGGKLAEPNPDHWRGYLLESVNPSTFLIVPHHVQRDHLRIMVSATSGIIIDRLRLALDLSDVSAAERAIFDAVVDCGVDDGRGVM